MAFFGGAKSLGGAPQDDQLLAGSIRIVIVGDPYVGKTSITELIANGRPIKACRSTAGCHIHVKLLDVPVSQPGEPANKKFFVELWDVSGQAKYEQLRSVFYKQVNGVILVYDLGDRRSLARLPKWAAEVARAGSFQAPFTEELAARNIGGLPVPVLVVGNKADRVRHGSAETLTSTINNACEVLSRSACSSWWQRSLAGLRGRRPPSESSMTPDVVAEHHVKGLTASAVAGQLDWGMVDSFLSGLWERRYKPLSSGMGSSGGGLEYMNRKVSYPGSSLAALGTATAGLLGASNDNERLDDDWV